MKYNNTQRQAIINAGTAHSLVGTLYYFQNRAHEDPQLKALLPIIEPKLEQRIDSLMDLAMEQWKIGKTYETKKN